MRIDPYQVTLFTDFFRTVDEVLGGLAESSSQGMIAYIMPIAWVTMGILFLVWAGAIWVGRGNSVDDLCKRMFSFVLILQFASVFYHAWVAAPIMNLPDELSQAVAKLPSAAAQGGGAVTSTSAADQLCGALEQLLLGVLQAGVEAFKSWNIGGALMLFLAALGMGIAGVLLLVGVVFNMLYAKIGLFYILAVGPLFIFFLAVPGVRNWFYGWLNTAFYFVMLAVFSTLSMVVFTGIANRFMQKLTAAVTSAWDSKLSLAESMFSLLTNAMTGQGGDASAVSSAAGNAVTTEVNVISIALQMILMFIPMFLVALETRTLVGSLTGGQGGSFGTGIVNVVSTAWRGGFGRHGAGGGKGEAGKSEGGKGEGGSAQGSGQQTA